MTLIQTIYPHEYVDYILHLQRLNTRDRRLRFGAAVSDEWIADYSRNLAERGGVLRGFYDYESMLRGAVEIHFGKKDSICELGLSLEPGWRQEGRGTELFDAGLLWARNRFCKKIFVHCLRENHAMQRIAKKYQMQIEHDTSDSDAYLLLEPQPFGQVQEFIEDFSSRFVFWLNRGRAF